jgi:hypothetical protein
MVYPSRGRRVWSGTVRDLSIVNALRELIGLGNGRLVYRAPDGAVFMLEVSSDGRAGCLGETGTASLRGEECLTEFARRVLSGDGSIEIIELTRAETALDFSAEPATLLSKGVEALRDLVELLGATLGAEKGTAATVPATAVVNVEEKLRSLRNISELFNPLAAAAIIAQGDRLFFEKPNSVCADIAAEILQVPDVRAVVLCEHGEEKLTVLIEKGVVKPLLERGDGTVLLGREAAARAATIPATKATVYIVH